MGAAPGRPVYTVGHSNHPIDRLLALLAAHGITRVLDVRAWPRSRRHPQFDREALTSALAQAGIGYTHVPELGGMRGPAAAAGAPRARVAGWRAGYRAHMRSEEFARGLARVIAAAGGDTVTLLCAEADPLDCHRSLVADALTGVGVEVRHVHPAGPARIHTSTGSGEQGDLGL